MFTLNPFKTLFSQNQSFSVDLLHDLRFTKDPVQQVSVHSSALTAYHLRLSKDFSFSKEIIIIIILNVCIFHKEITANEDTI